MIDPTLMDAITGGSSFILSAIGTLMSKNAERIHEERLYRYKTQKLDISDTQSARQNNSSFVGWTRRIIAWTIVFLFIGFFIVAVKKIPVVMPITETHQFLFFKWATTKVVSMNGLIYLPWFQQWAFLIGGFYFGRLINK